MIDELTSRTPTAFGTVDLSQYTATYRHTRSIAVRSAWFFFGLPLLRSAVIPSSSFRVKLLRLFGATVGAGVVIKPGVRVKFPWNLEVGDNCWIGEESWIDNLDLVKLGNNVCVSQGTYFCTGSHDWSDPAFGLRTAGITVHDGAWVCARAFVGPGVELGRGAVLGAAAVATKPIAAGEVHAGNPARFVRERAMKR